MRTMPLTIGRTHFVGIGGIGMSGIAEVLNNLGYQVQGSDVAESANVQRLRDLGIPVAIGHDAANVAEAQVVGSDRADIGAPNGARSACVRMPIRAVGQRVVDVRDRRAERVEAAGGGRDGAGETDLEELEKRLEVIEEELEPFKDIKF